MRKVTARTGAAAAIAVALSAAAPATSSAEPAAHQVRYTVTVTSDAGFDFNYLTSQPPSKEAYNDDPYAFMTKERVNIAGVWTFETTLEDPQWAIITASAAAHGGRAAPNPHCEIAIDGQLVVQHDGQYAVQCQLSQW